MADSCQCHHHAPAVLDVRGLAPRDRHPAIFEACDALAPGAALVLVNDHDPKPLYYQFTFERPGAFEWRYLEEGPETWRVEITRRAAAAPAGSRAGIPATATIAHVLEHYPQTLGVMERFGVNHCCGAHLTLTEAAASAGVAVDSLVAALDEAVSLRA